MEKIIVNAKNAILGRMASFVAKELLKGKSVDIINAEETIVSGNPENFAKNIVRKRNMGRGSSLKGPTYIRKEELLVKRMIRGMLPMEKTKGREAFRNLKCHMGHGKLAEHDIKKAISLDHQIPLKHATIKHIIQYIK